jgi:hypothetical protein
MSLGGQHGKTHSTKDNQIIPESVEKIFEAIKRQAKKRAAAKKNATKRLSQRYEAPTGSLKGREARAEERFRELAAWYMLQGMDEATARQHAQHEMDDNTRKD